MQFASAAFMDHRWDDHLRDEQRRRDELQRFGTRRIESDADVDRRDQLALARRRANKSPWEIGAAHWNQRDLYTRNNHVDDSGYGRGPSVHPDVGSYAYPREERLPEHVQTAEGPSVYEREAWPWLNYDRYQSIDDEEDEGAGLWGKMKNGVTHVVDVLTGQHHGKGPKNWRRADPSIYEDVCEALAEHHEIDASDIEVTVKDGEVTLEGTVRDRASKRAAEYAVEGCRGVVDVHNRLKIRKDDDDLTFTAPIRAM